MSSDYLQPGCSLEEIDELANKSDKPRKVLRLYLTAQQLDTLYTLAENEGDLGDLMESLRAAELSAY